VVDVDPRNGGDIEKVRAQLAELKVRVFAEITSPSGGKHFYIAGHEALPSVHGKIPGFRGMDIQSFGTNVFLPGTQRPKYQGAGYTIVFDDLDALADGGDAAGAEAFAHWVAKSLAEHARQKAKSPSKWGRSDLEFEPAAPWSGGATDARQQAYLDRVLEENAKKAAQAVPGERNEALYLAALKCSSFVAGAGMDRQLVLDVLADAAAECGLVDDDGIGSVHATIWSGFRIGLRNPRAVPESSANPAGTSASDDECQRLEDAYIGKRIADDYLADRFLHSGAFGWMKFDGRRWKEVNEAIVAEEVGQGVIEFYCREARARADADRLKQISGLFSANRMKAILWVAKGYLSLDADEFDQVVGPVDGVAQRLVALQAGAATAGQQFEPLIEPRDEVLR
jgi:hypothetical protein